MQQERNFNIAMRLLIYSFTVCFYIVAFSNPFLPQEWRYTPMSVVLLLYSIPIFLIRLWLFLTTSKRRTRGGATLLAIPLPGSGLAFAIIFLLFLFSYIFFLVFVFNITFSPLFIIAFLLFSCAILLSLFNKFEIMERGIFTGDEFIPWDKIESYGWKGKNAQILTIKLKKRRLLPKKYSWLTKGKYNETANRVLMQGLW